MKCLLCKVVNGFLEACIKALELTDRFITFVMEKII